MNKFMIVVLLSSFGAIEASNLPPNLGSLSITKTLECLLPVGNTVRPEDPPLIPLVPVPQGDLWPPPDPDLPLYFENPSLRVTDADLQDLLDSHLNFTNRPGFALKVYRPTPPPQNEDLRFVGCQDLELRMYYAGLNPTPIAEAYLDVLSCDSNFEFRNASAYYYPPFIAATKCINSITQQQTCSFPRGANCAINRSCNFNDLHVLRWDCCWTWDTQMKDYVYDCGWRRVRIPIPTACLCLCANRLNLVGLTRPPPPT